MKNTKAKSYSKSKDEKDGHQSGAETRSSKNERKSAEGKPSTKGSSKSK